MIRHILAFFIFIFSISYEALCSSEHLSPLSELTSEEMAKIQAGEFILKTKEKANAPWPEVTYYLTIQASSLESVGIFAAYDIQKEYTPNLLSSTPVKQVSATDVQTKYEMRIPFPLPNAHYIHGAKLFNHGDEKYEVSWYLVESTSAESIDGSALFIPFEGKTLLKYRTFVKPKSIFGKLVKNIMVKDVKASLEAIKNFTEKTKNENPALIKKYSEYITRSFDGDFVYLKKVD